MFALTAMRELRRKAHGKSWPQIIGMGWGRITARLAVVVTRAYYQTKYRRHVTFGQGVVIKGQLVISGAGRVVIGNHCTFDTAGGKPNKILTFHADARVVLGDHSYINSAEFACREAITVGRRGIIGECLLMDTDFHSIEINRWNPQAPVKTKPINIGENVWIANRTVILKGITIGNNSVVGAGTVIRSSVPNNVVVIGNPQQIVKELDAAIAAYEPVI